MAIHRGLDFRDLICPDGLAFKAGHFEMGDKVGRVLFLKDYASYIKDEMIADLSDFPRNLMLSIDRRRGFGGGTGGHGLDCGTPGLSIWHLLF